MPQSFWPRTAAMLAIPGTIVRGFGGASTALKSQMPHFVKVHPELEICSLRTINVVLECQLEIISPTFLIGPIQWQPQTLREMFGFKSIEFEFGNPIAKTHAWIYLPYNSPHRLNPFYAEILAPELQLNNSPACKIHISAGKVIA
jgi:hypothetical protein